MVLIPLEVQVMGVYSSDFYSWFWKWVAATGTGGTYGRRFSPIGQGFMIEGSATGNVVMKIIIEFL
jgi:hypothetical protein